jgi:hypothetical protein
MVPSLIPEQWTTNLREPSPFLTNKIGAAAGEEEAQMNPLDRFWSSHHLSSSNSGHNREQRGLEGGLNPSTNGSL